jgi:hypothetical protein
MSFKDSMYVKLVTAGATVVTLAYVVGAPLKFSTMHIM